VRARAQTCEHKKGVIGRMTVHRTTRVGARGPPAREKKRDRFKRIGERPVGGDEISSNGTKTQRARKVKDMNS